MADKKKEKALHESNIVVQEETKEQPEVEETPVEEAKPVEKEIKVSSPKIIVDEVKQI